MVPEAGGRRMKKERYSSKRTKFNLDWRAKF
jgi:hypothetical protein